MAPPASHVVPVDDLVRHAVDVGASPAHDHGDTGRPGRLDTALGGLGADEQDPGLGVLEDVRGFGGSEMEVDRDRRRTREQPAEVRERGLRRVLGEHGDPVIRTEVARPIGGQQEVGATVQRLVDLGPGHDPVTVDEREPGRVERGLLFRETGHQGPIGRPLAGRSNPP